MTFLIPGNKKKTVKNPKKYFIDWDKQSRSKIQTSVKLFLQRYWDQDIVFEEFPVVGTRLTLDIFNANKRIAIEVQGGQHVKFISFFHKNRLDFANQIKRDMMKENFCALNNIKLITIFEKEKITKELFESQGVIL